MSERMMALVLTEAGGSDVLHLREVERPALQKDTDILVRVLAAGINPADWQNRKVGGGFDPAPGQLVVLGIDGVGVIEAVGAAVQHLQVGQEVWYIDGGFTRKFGSYAEYKVVDGRYATPKPRTLDASRAAALPVAGLTAWEAVHKAPIRPGDFVLVHGGAGGLGHLTIQLARRLGARVAATVTTEAQARFVRTVGAERAILHGVEDVTVAVRSWTGKDGADQVFDFVGRENFARSFEHVSAYGTLISTVVSPWPGEGNGPAEYRNLDIHLVNIGYPQITGHHIHRLRQTEILQKIADLVDAGELSVHIDRVVGFDGVGAAHDALEGGKTMGRVVLELARR